MESHLKGPLHIRKPSLLHRIKSPDLSTLEQTLMNPSTGMSFPNDLLTPHCSLLDRISTSPSSTPSLSSRTTTSVMLSLSKCRLHHSQISQMSHFSLEGDPHEV